MRCRCRQPRRSTRVIGYCWGGQTVLVHAINGGVPGFSGGVAFYGLPYMNGNVPIGDSLQKITKPVMLLSGSKDARITAGMPAVDSAMKALQQELLGHELRGRGPRLPARAGRPEGTARSGRGAGEPRRDEGRLAEDDRVPEEEPRYSRATLAAAGATTRRTARARTVESTRRTASDATSSDGPPGESPTRDVGASDPASRPDMVAPPRDSTHARNEIRLCRRRTRHVGRQR